ncbi:MAG: hypothetical protein ACI9QL_001192 [Candidatus Omnitrophota bacterium]|jgi:hypothetical protein
MAQPLISEFLASNGSSMLDGDGLRSDWIEIYNPDTNAIQLAGWHLTDDASTLTKWAFPSVVLAPGDFLVVFASGKDEQPYLDPAGNLHTNFRIDQTGEYLALVMPDGTNVVSAFDSFPPQVADASYGSLWQVGTGVSNLIASAQTQILVPADDALGSTWIELDFDPSGAWTNSPGPGVGFDVDSTNGAAHVVAAWSFDDAPGANSIEDQVGVFHGVPNGGVAGGGVGANAETGTSIGFNAGGIDIPYAAELNPDSFTFAAWVRVASGGSGHRSVVTSRMDDAVTVSGYILYATPGNEWQFWTGAGGPSGSWNVLNGPAVVLDTWQHLAISWDAASATKTLTIDGVLAATTTAQGYAPNIARDTHLGSGADTGTQFRFFGDIDEAILWSEAVDPSVLTGHMNKGNAAATAISFDALIDLDLQTEMFEQAVGAYVRHVFDLSDPSIFDRLHMNIHFDDGFVAYLNGVSITSRNAPANPAWNDAANALREDEAALDAETIDLSAHLSLLTSGTNLLAVHGMNRASDEPDFLVRAELSGTNTGSPTALTGYLIPTPGDINGSESLQPGPSISEVMHRPERPGVNTNFVITAWVIPRLAPVQSVTLMTRVNFGAESSLVMHDDGLGDDVLALDGIFTVTLTPANQGASGLDLLRYRIVAEDNAIGRTRAPAFLDQESKSQSPEYYGTVVDDPAFVSSLPIFLWYTDDVPNSGTRIGSRASVYYNGRFYDNLYVRQRGGFTSTNSQKFDFNKGDPVYVNEKIGKVGELNLNTSGTDNTAIRQPLAFQMYEVAQSPASESFNVLMVRNGSVQRVGHLIEQVDEDFLDRHGFDSDGAMYKFVQRSNLNPMLNDTSTGVEKKTRTFEDFSDLDEFIDAIKNGSEASRQRALFDRVDLPRFTNFMAAKTLVRDVDSIRKNLYMHRDTLGSGEWTMFPWDEDHTFGNTSPGTFANHIFLGDADHKLACCDQWNVLYDLYNKTPYAQQMFLRRLRTLMDEMIGPPGTPADASIIEQRADAISVVTQPHSGTTAVNIKSWVGSWRNNLYVNFGAGGAEPLIPASQVTQPDIQIGEILFNPTGTQDAEYIELINPSLTDAVDLSGWSVTGGVDFVFVPGTVLPAATNLFVSPRREVFRARATSPTGNEGRLVVGNYSGHLSSFGETVRLMDAFGALIDSETYPGDPSDPQQYLVVSEIMYHPLVDADAEYIELLNISDSVTLELEGVRFSEGVLFIFPVWSLPPGSRVLVVKDRTVFDAAYTNNLPVAGVFQPDTRLDNDGDRIKLEDADGSTVQDFRYNDAQPWPPAADGFGSALQLLAPYTQPDHDLPQNWYTGEATPGVASGTRFVGDPFANVDGDDDVALIEYALAGDDGLAHIHAEGIIHRDIATRRLLSYVINTGAEDVQVILQWSPDLGGWLDVPDFLTFDSLSRSEAGRGTVTWSLEDVADPIGYFRLKVIK